MESALSIISVSKSFPGVQALKNVSMDVRPGEVHALVGENGAGKSTLINIISGVYRPDSGEIKLFDETVDIQSSHQARRLGINTVYQELSVVPQLTVAENIFLGREPRTPSGFFDWNTLFKEAQKVIDTIGYEIDARTRVDTLPIAEQQMVEIARCVSAESKIIIMDEPTSSLSRTEVLKLFKTIETLKSEGIGIIYVSHEMNEIFEISDRITVLRNGEIVTTVNTDEITHAELVRLMVGREVDFDEVKEPTTKEIEPDLLRVEGFTNSRLHDVTFSVGKREIVGIVGIVGSGKTELARALFGLDKVSHGKITLEGKVLNIDSPLSAIKQGLGYVTESRRDDGLVLVLCVRENTCLVILDQIAKLLGFVRQGDENSLARQSMSELSIKATGPNQRVEYLSGGNQQKVVLSKWLLRNPKVLVLDEPTRGIDVGTRQEFYSLLEEVSEKGTGVLVLTSDVREAMRVSDRLLIMRKGRIVGELKPPNISYTQVLEIMTGGTE